MLPRGLCYLCPFLGQSTLSTRWHLVRLEKLPLNIENKFGDMATKVFNNKEEEAKKESERNEEIVEGIWKKAIPVSNS